MKSNTAWCTAGVINDADMNEYDALCLPPPPVKEYSATKIKRLRARVHVSQAALAGYLNTTVATVRQWEKTDGTHPKGPSLRLLNLIDRKGLAAVCA